MDPLHKGFSARSASLSSGSVNTKNRLVDVEGIFVNNDGVRHLTLKSAPPTLRQQNEVGFLVIQVGRAANLITPHKQFGKFLLGLTRYLRSVDEKGFGVAERREGFARFAQVYDLGGFPLESILHTKRADGAPSVR